MSTNVVGVCVCGGVLNLKLLIMSLKVPPPVRLYVSTSSFCRGEEHECQTTLFVASTSLYLLTCINVFFCFTYILSGEVS